MLVMLWWIGIAIVYAKLCILQRQDINALIRLMGFLALNGDLSKRQWFIKTPKAHSMFIRNCDR